MNNDTNNPTTTFPVDAVDATERTRHHLSDPTLSTNTNIEPGRSNPRRHRPGLGSALLAAAALTATFLTAQPVSAATPTKLTSYELVRASSSHSPSAKSVTATCPAGRRVVGTGVDIFPDFGGVVINSVIPNAALTSVTATAYNAEVPLPEGYDWQVSATAICADAPAGLERVVASTPLNSDSAKIILAECPAGKTLLGMGGQIPNGVGQVNFQGMVPTGPFQGVRVAAAEDDTGYASNWAVRAMAICATAPVDQTEITATSMPSHYADKSIFAKCPAGQKVTSAGFLVKGSRKIQIQRFGASSWWSPPDAGNASFADAHEDRTGEDDDSWSVSTHGVCTGVVFPQ